MATAQTRQTMIPTVVFPSDQGGQKTADLQLFMARARIELATPRFSVKELEAMVSLWLQGLS
jgi:hypothetical protein